MPTRHRTPGRFRSTRSGSPRCTSGISSASQQLPPPHAYDAEWILHNPMGLNALWLDGEIVPGEGPAARDARPRPGVRQGDLEQLSGARGRGPGLATDRWIPPTDGLRRIEEAGLSDPRRCAQPPVGGSLFRCARPLGCAHLLRHGRPVPEVQAEVRPRRRAAHHRGPGLHARAARPASRASQASWGTGMLDPAHNRMVASVLERHEAGEGPARRQPSGWLEALAAREAAPPGSRRRQPGMGECYPGPRGRRWTVRRWTVCGFLQNDRRGSAQLS